MNKGRKEWLDIARGICIICMVCCHAFDWSRRNSDFIWVTGTWFLVFFFFCSGLCFSNKYDLKKYIVQQGKKLLIPYFAVVIAYLFYRVHHGMWWDIPAATKVRMFLASLFTALPADFKDVLLFNTDTIGIGPIWFFMCMFVASVMYKVLYNVKGKLIICVFLAGVAAWSQKYMVVPFNLQNACIGCMFIALGDALRKPVFRFVEWVKKIPYLIGIVSCVGANVLHVFLLSTVRNQILNLGGNTYSLYSLTSSFSGFLFLILLAVLIEKIGYVNKFFSHYGRESLGIVVAHSLDILMLRNWSMRGNWFLIGTILLYPTIIYIYRKMKNHLVSQKIKTNAKQ